MINWADVMLRGAAAGWGVARAVAKRVGWVAALVILLWFSGKQCGRSKDLAAELARAKEEIALAQHGVAVVQQDDRALKTAIADLNAEKQVSAVLRTALTDAEKRIREATGKPPKVIEVVRYVTVPGGAGGEAPPDRPACLIARGDVGQIRGTSVKLETHAGNHVITGTAAFWRLQPAPESLVYEGAIDLGSVKAAEKAPEVSARTRPWIIGAVGSWSARDGDWSVGPQVGWMGSRVGGTIGATFPDGRIIGSAIGRW